ncbi:MAG TPA: hypothetical protein VGM77_02035 [Gemmatimonadales bacterium]|jgi:hypothetical protein
MRVTLFRIMLCAAAVVVVMASRAQAQAPTTWHTDLSKFMDSVRSCVKTDCDLGPTFMGQTVTWQGTYQSSRRGGSRVLAVVSTVLADSAATTKSGERYVLECCNLLMKDSADIAIAPGTPVTFTATFGPQLSVVLGLGKVRTLLTGAVITPRKP